MSQVLETRDWAADDLRFLAYAQHMAQTAQCDSAKRLFELFAQQEARRIETNGGFQSTASRHGIGGEQAPTR